MMQRTVVDQLREEYSVLSPEINRVLLQLRTDVAHLLLGTTLGLKHHERILIEARAKECESAIDALRRREEARQFEEDAPERYSLTKLPDLAALRILVFPKLRLEEVHASIRVKYSNWTPNPVETGNPAKWRAWKYFGHCPASQRVQAEIQVVPMLTGLFWQVEHDAFYKPRDPVLRGAVNKPKVHEHTEAVYEAFESLEMVLEHELQLRAEQV